MGKLRKFFAVLFTIFLCISIAATILFSGTVRTMEPDRIDEIVGANPEDALKISEKYMDVNQKMEDIFNSSAQMKDLLGIIEQKGKTIQDVKNMLGKNVFSGIVSKYASGLTEYIVNSNTNVKVTKEEIRIALENSRSEFEIMLGEDISDTNWDILSGSFDKLATDIATNLPDYASIENEFLGNASDFQKTVVNSVVSGNIVWICFIVSIISAIMIILLVWNPYKWILNFGLAAAFGGATSYITCLILNLYSGIIISENIMEKFVLRVVSLINMVSFVFMISGLVLIVIYIIINRKKSLK